MTIKTCIQFTINESSRYLLLDLWVQFCSGGGRGGGGFRGVQGSGGGCRGYQVLLNDHQRKIEIDQTVMRRWNIIGINVDVFFIQRICYQWGGALGIYTGGGVPLHIRGGLRCGHSSKGGLMCGHKPKKGGGYQERAQSEKVSSQELILYKERILGTEVAQKWVLGSLFITFIYVYLSI